MPRQPEVNIGMVGHVDHGKTTLTKAITGVFTDTYTEEIKRGVSIKLGYADAAFYRCVEDGKERYLSHVNLDCKGDLSLSRVVSFVDSPGHESLMATMLSGAAIMNGALLLVAANQPTPRPQTKEHLKALEIVGVSQIIIVQNKIDIVNEDRAKENYNEIMNFIKGTIAESAPVIPVSAQRNINIDILIEAIEKFIKTPEHDVSKPPKMYVARSFDVNKPGTFPDKLLGGILGGSLIQGEFHVGDEIEISPGIQVTQKGKIIWEPLHADIVSLFSGGRSWESVRPGGLVAIGTKLDPSLTKQDGLTGRMVGKPGTLPDILMDITIDVHLLDYVLGHVEEIKVEKIKTNETLMLNVGTTTTVGVVRSARGDVADISLKYPVIAEKNQRVAISRKIQNRWRLIGYGILK
ncbi:MAG: translation initiation factor IF-2 subunit gamma [Thermoplasmata archaeon]